MTMIQITEDKKEKMSEICEKMLHYGGKMMQCLESLGDEEVGHREWDDPYMPRMGRREYPEMGMRDEYGMRRSARTGRYY